MTLHPNIPTNAEVEGLVQWAEAGEFDPAAPRGARSPRVNVAIPETMDEVLK